jgi:hypothetical protein
MSGKDSVIWEPLTVVASGSVTTSFVAAVTITSPAVAMLIKNGTNGDIVIGIDGITPKWGFPASSGSAYDIKTNAPSNTQLMLQNHTTIYVKWQGSAPGTPTGNLYIEFMEVDL